MWSISVFPENPCRTKRIVPTMNSMNATMRSNSCSSAHFCRNVGKRFSNVAIRRDDLRLLLRGWERRGRVHQAERLPVFLQRLGELGVLLFLLRFDLALGVVAVGNVLHERGRRGLIDFVVGVVERGGKPDE